MTPSESVANDLHAREQIRRISAAYVHAIDKRDSALFEQIWAEDATWVPAPSLPECQGKAEILDMLKKIWAGYERTHHFATNHLIDVEGDGNVATAETDLLAESLDRDGNWHRLAATHHDRYERRDGRWMLVRRTCDAADLESVR